MLWAFEDAAILCRILRTSKSVGKISKDADQMILSKELDQQLLNQYEVMTQHVGYTINFTTATENAINLFVNTPDPPTKKLPKVPVIDDSLCDRVFGVMQFKMWEKEDAWMVCYLNDLGGAESLIAVLYE